MTAITAPALTPSTRLRMTTRGRRVLTAAAALPLAALLAFTVLSGGSALASRDAGSATATSFATITVAYGDTLWSIAQTVAPQHDPRDVVDAIARLNALPGGAIELGQSLAIPAEYSSGR